MDFIEKFVGVLPNPRIEAIIRTDSLLKEIGTNAHEDAVAVLAGQQELSANIDFAEAVEKSIYDHALNAIALHGIRLSEEVTPNLRTLMIILSGLVALASASNDDIVESTLETYEDNHELLCHMLGEVEENNAMWFMETIDYVDVDIINRLKRGLNDHLFNEDIEDRTTELITAYKKYMEGKDFTGIVATSLQSVESLPLSFRAAAVDLQGELTRSLPDVYVEELYQLAILSSTTEDFVEDVHLTLVAFGKDIGFVTDVNNVLRQRGFDVGEVL